MTVDILSEEGRVSAVFKNKVFYLLTIGWG